MKTYITIFFAILVSIIITQNTHASHYVSRDGKYTSEGIQLSINSFSVYGHKRDSETGKVTPTSSHGGYFQITADPDYKIGHFSYIVYEKKKYFFKGANSDIRRFYTRSLRLKINKNLGYGTFKLGLLYTLKTPSGETKVFKRFLSIRPGKRINSRQFKLLVSEAISDDNEKEE